MEKPNILVFMTDQQRGDTVLEGHPAFMPRARAFAKEGLTLSRAFCPSPHCCPSRATFFSGLYPTEHGVWHNVTVQNAITRGLKPGTALWSDALGKAGYRLEYNGKWHVSHEEDPADRGWNMGWPAAKPGGRKEFHDRTWGQYRELAAEKTGARVAGEIRRPGWPKYVHYGENEGNAHDEQTVAAGVAALEKLGRGKDPWALYVGTIGPHDPYFVPKRFLDLYKNVEVPLPPSFEDRMLDKPGLYRRTRGMFDQLSPEEHREAIRHYWAYCSYQDELFGRVLDALDRTGQRENTLVVYLSDHGDYTGEHGLWCKGLPCFRGAYHVPALVRWPARLKDPGRREDGFVSLADFAPSFLEAAGLSPASPLTGQSLMPFIENKRPAAWRDAIFTQTQGNELYGIQRSITTDRWKYVYNGFDFDELYDLSRDPHETKNLAALPQHKATVEALMARIWEFGSSRGEHCANPYIMVGLAPVGPASAFAAKPA